MLPGAPLDSIMDYVGFVGVRSLVCTGGCWMPRLAADDDFFSVEDEEEDGDDGTSGACEADEAYRMMAQHFLDAEEIIQLEKVSRRHADAVEFLRALEEWLSDDEDEEEEEEEEEIDLEQMQKEMYDADPTYRAFRDQESLRLETARDQRRAAILAAAGTSLESMMKSIVPPPLHPDTAAAAAAAATRAAGTGAAGSSGFPPAAPALALPPPPAQNPEIAALQAQISSLADTVNTLAQGFTAHS